MSNGEEEEGKNPRQKSPNAQPDWAGGGGRLTEVEVEEKEAGRNG
jgi:hypothetical protein